VEDHLEEEDPPPGEDLNTSSQYRLRTPQQPSTTSSPAEAYGRLEGRNQTYILEIGRQTARLDASMEHLCYSNLHTRNMRVPMQRLAIALGYFRGERVMEWARQQIELAITSPARNEHT